ncbi:hypothetical protein ASE01_15930 [Nocardioides sp. Root190]|uniref:hypothetical protein n=1 Tax=Nocardioides sp. Root190 TaxID=1736488 RepID=UPI0006F6B60C|nr:hypothetical protein [Nocardioides sp. Root190]KRB76451.1 hypothetical protein ASE01_15930 [Nocardioides sp. Root190]
MAADRGNPARFVRSLTLLGVLLLWWAFGPWVLLLAMACLGLPRVRQWLRPTRRVLLAWVGAIAAVVLVVVLVPDGRLPIPPGAGALVTPSYAGSPVSAQPIEITLPQHPSLAANGRSAMHNDGWSSDAYAGAGPLGLDPEVDTAWFGVKECATLAFDSAGRLIALCGNLRGAIMHVLDPASMAPQATLVLPERGDGRGRKPWENLCGGAYFYLDAEDRAVLATTDRRILTVSTSDARGEPALHVETAVDLTDEIPAEDCLIALMPDWRDQGTWWVTRDGRVGLAPSGSTPDEPSPVLELGEEIVNSVSVGADGGLYAVTTHRFVKLRAVRGRIRTVWEQPYDRGSQVKPGQLSQGSGTTPTLMPGGLVAITDNAEPRMHVQFHRQSDGALVCREPVFGDDESATENSLVLVDRNAVVVENNHGYSSPLRTILGRATPGGFARVEVDPDTGTCSTAWTNEIAAPTSVAKASLANGLVYAYTKKSSPWGVNAWYLTAMDARTGRLAFEVRTGIGILFNNNYAAVTLGPDSSVYVATLAGMVRVRDTG